MRIQRHGYCVLPPFNLKRQSYETMHQSRGISVIKYSLPKTVQGDPGKGSWGILHFGTRFIGLLSWSLLVFLSVIFLKAAVVYADNDFGKPAAPLLNQDPAVLPAPRTLPLGMTISQQIAATPMRPAVRPVLLADAADPSWWNISADGTLTIGGSHNLSELDTQTPNWQQWPWYSQRTAIKKVVIEPGVTATQTLGFLFEGCTQLTDVQGLGNIKVKTDNWNTAAVNTMYGMFLNCSALKSIDLTGLVTTSVTNFGHMFAGCSALTSLDLSTFNTSSAIDMSSMFSECSALTKLNVGSFDTGQVRNMDSMFNQCTVLTNLDLSAFDVRQVTTMATMFRYCKALKQLTLSSKFVTSNVTTMFGMFLGCQALTQLDLSSFDTSKVTSMQQMFNTCSSLTALDLSSFNTSNVTDMAYMFNACNGLIKLNISSFRTSKVKYMQFMFYVCSSLPDLDVTNFDTSNVLDMSYMFASDPKLNALDLTSFDTSKVTTMYWLFYGDSGLKAITFTPTKFNTGNVTNMVGMFGGCSSLTALDVSHFDTAKTKAMNQMFWNYAKLTTLDLSHFNTSQVTDMSWMFYQCASLTKLDLRSFDTRKVGTMWIMFAACPALTSLDVSSFNTSACRSFASMFIGDSKLTTLDLSGFDTRNYDQSVLGNLGKDAFNGCTSLWRLSVGDKTTLVNSSLPGHAVGAIAQNDPTYKAAAGWQELGAAADPLEAAGAQFSNSTALTTELATVRVGTVNPATGKPVWTYVWQPQRWWTINGDTLTINAHTLNFATDKYSTETWPWYSQRSAIKHVVLATSGLNAQGAVNGLFKGLSKTVDIANLKRLDLSRATDISDMFNGCAALTNLDLSTLDTRQVTNETGMFTGTTTLWLLVLGPNFKTTTDALGLGGPVPNTVITRTDTAGQAHSYIVQSTDTAWQALGTTGTILAPAGTTYTPADLIKLYNNSTRPTTIQTYVWQQTSSGTIALTISGSFDYGKHFQPQFSGLNAKNAEPFTINVTDSRADRANMPWHIDVLGSDFVSDDDAQVKVSTNPWRFNSGSGAMQSIATPYTIWQNTSNGTDTAYIKTWAANPFELDFAPGSVPIIGKYHATVTFTLTNGL